MAPSLAVNASGAILAVWEEHAPETGSGTGPAPAGVLRGALLGGGAPQPFDIAAGGMFAPRWPTVISTGNSFLLGFVDETTATSYTLRGLRLQSNGQPNPSDAKPGAPTSLPAFGESP